jgi:hypothetical protein
MDRHDLIYIADEEMVALEARVSSHADVRFCIRMKI